jgi:CHAT domain-containing protein
MQAFYAARFNEQMKVADAVYSASFDELRKRRSNGETTHPFYWASFVSAVAWQ